MYYTILVAYEAGPAGTRPGTLTGCCAKSLASAERACREGFAVPQAMRPKVVTCVTDIRCQTRASGDLRQGSDGHPEPATATPYRPKHDVRPGVLDGYGRHEVSRPLGISHPRRAAVPAPPAPTRPRRFRAALDQKITITSYPGVTGVPQSSRRSPGEMGVAPYRGDAGMARSQLGTHIRMWWSGRCVCGDPYPCHTRALCLITLHETEPEPGLAGRTVVLCALLAILCGVLLFGAVSWVS